MEIDPVVEVAEAAFGVAFTVLRLLDGEEFPGGPVTYLVEAPAIDPDRLTPWPAPLLDDPNRAAYAEVGGPAELLGWATGELRRGNRPPTGRPVQGRSWNLAATWRIPTAPGSAWLKATPRFLGHEPAVLELLGSQAPGAVPTLLAGRPGAAVMDHVDGIDGYEIDPAGYLGAVDVLRALQDAVDPTRLVAAGVPPFGPGEMAAGLADLLDRHGGELNDVERARLQSLLGEIGDRFEQASFLPDSLVHGDFHGGNLRISPPGAEQPRRPVILDWGDSFVGNPLFDLISLDSYYEHWPSWVRERWLATWEVSAADLAAGWRALRPLAALKLAITYRMFCDNIEAAEQPYHQGDVVPAIRRGLTALA